MEIDLDILSMILQIYIQSRITFCHQYIIKPKGHRI